MRAAAGALFAALIPKTHIPITAIRAHDNYFIMLKINFPKTRSPCSTSSSQGLA